jgi:hypothetical protein
VSILGTIGMLAAMAIVVGKLVVLYVTAPEAAPTEVVASSTSFQVGLCLDPWPQSQPEQPLRQPCPLN